MSEERRFYWLKLKEDFFENDTIDYLLSQKNGEKLCLFYLILCCKSLKDDGRLIRYVGNTLIPYDTEGLAKLTRTDKKTVETALNLFIKIGLIERLETGEIYLSQINEMIGSETGTAERMRKFRAREKNKRNNVTAECNNVTTTLHERYTEKEIDIEKEKEIDIEKEKEGEDVFKDVTPSFFIIPETIPTFEEVFNFYKKEKLKISPDYFYLYNSSKGWKTNNGEKIKNWKLAYLAMNENATEVEQHSETLTLEQSKELLELRKECT